MADLNALIAQGAQFQAPIDPFAQYGKMQQLQQGQQANALNQMKMEEYQRGLQEQNALRSSVSSDFDINNPAHVNAVLRASPTAGAAFLEKFSQGAKERGLAEKAKNEAIKFNLDNSRSLLVGINDQPSYDAWRAYSVKTLPQLADMLPTAFSQDAKDRLMQAADDVSKKLTAAPVYENAAPGATVLRNGVPIYTAPAAPEKPTPPPVSIAEYERAKTDPEFMKFLQARAAAIRAPATPATPAAPVAVVGADGKVKYVSREDAINKGMTPASAMEGLAPKEIQNREAKYPVAKRATATVSATMTEIENTIDRLLANESGLNGITGFVGGRTIAVTNEARKAEADLKQLKNLAFVQGLTELRNASSTGAGVGNVSNKEGDRFENLKASLEQTQSKDDLVASLKRLKSQSTATRDTVNQAFEDTYAYRANAPAAPAPKPSGGGTPPPPPGFKPD
jgi:hypothetical protein